jgi:FkbM family methyltransferase
MSNAPSNTSTDRPSRGLFPRMINELARNWPFIRGRDFMNRSSRSNPSVYTHLLSLDEWTKTRENFDIKTNKVYDYTSYSLRLFGDLEPFTKSFVLSNMEPSTTFLDVGANVGYFGLLVAAKFTDCNVLSFEPNPAIASCLQESITRNKLESRMKLVRHAVSNQAGFLPFVVESENTGHSRLAASGSGDNIINVECVVFDEWVKTHPMPSRVSCIKMDVEGAEVMALQGMRELLERDRPALCVEGYDSQLREFGSSLGELKALLQESGYKEVSPFDGNLYMRHSSKIL